MEKIEELSIIPLTQKLVKSKELSLTEILESEKLIITDNSVEMGGVNEFTRWLYELYKPSQLNIKILREEFSNLTCLQELLTHPNVYTIKEVTEEKQKLKQILSEKINYFKKHDAHLKNTRWKKRKMKEDNSAFETLLELQKLAYQNMQISEDKELNQQMDNVKYDSLIKIVKLLSQEMSLKKDTSFLKGLHEKDQSNDSNTDEKLVAALYYFSLYSNKSPCILTSDTDFISLIGVTTRLMGADSFLPNNEIFRKRAIENPFRLYFKPRKENLCYLKINSLDEKYIPTFDIMGISKKRSLEIEEEVRQELKKLDV